MFEGLKDAKKLGASVAAAGALAIGAGATTAESAPVTNKGGDPNAPGIEDKGGGPSANH